jgi:hypothetical protein
MKAALTIERAGYGQYILYTTYYGKEVSLYSTDSKMVDSIEDGNEKSKKLAIKKIRNNAKSI